MGVEYVSPEVVVGPIPVPAPKPHEGRVSVLVKRAVTNMPIRVPTQDWDAVSCGVKRVFRAYSENPRDIEAPIVPPETECPRPVLLFTARHTFEGRKKRWEAIPAILLSHHQEPLGAITPDDLAAEGFEATLPSFKTYWRNRYRTLGWRPWTKVSVIEVAPWEEMGDTAVGEWATAALFEEWL